MLDIGIGEKMSQSYEPEEVPAGTRETTKVAATASTTTKSCWHA